MRWCWPAPSPPGGNGVLRETVILKVLGARRADLLAALGIEYLLLGLSAAVVASALGSAAARELVLTLLKTKWTFLAGRWRPQPLVPWRPFCS